MESIYLEKLPFLEPKGSMSFVEDSVNVKDIVSKFFNKNVIPPLDTLGKIGVEKSVKGFNLDFLNKASQEGTPENKLWNTYIKEIINNAGGSREDDPGVLYEFYKDLKENPRKIDAISDYNKISNPIKSPFKFLRFSEKLEEAIKNESMFIDLPNRIQGATHDKLKEIYSKLLDISNGSNNESFKRQIEKYWKTILLESRKGKRGVKTKVEVPIKINVKGIKDYRNNVIGGDKGVDYFTHLYNIPSGELEGGRLKDNILSKYIKYSRYYPENKTKSQELSLLQRILELNGLLKEDLTPSLEIETKEPGSVSTGEWYSLNNINSETFHNFQKTNLPGVSVRDYLRYILVPEEYSSERGFDSEGDDDKWFKIKAGENTYPIYGLPYDIAKLDSEYRFDNAFLPSSELGPDLSLKNKDKSDIDSIFSELSKEGDTIPREVLDKTIGKSSGVYDKLSNPDNIYVGSEVAELFNLLSVSDTGEVFMPTKREDAFNFINGLQGLRKYFTYDDKKNTLTKVRSTGRNKADNKGLRYEHVIPMKVMGRIVSEMYNASKDKPDFNKSTFIKEAQEVVEKLYTIAWIDIDKDNQLDFAGLKSDMGGDFEEFIKDLSSGKTKIRDISEDELWNKILSRYRKAGILGVDEKLTPVSKLPKVKKVNGGIEFPFYNIYFSPREYTSRATNENKKPKLTGLLFGYY